MEQRQKNKTNQKHLNVNKHQSDNHSYVKGSSWGQSTEERRKVRHRWHATQHRSSTTHLQDWNRKQQSNNHTEVQMSQLMVLKVAGLELVWLGRLQPGCPVREKVFNTADDEEDDDVTGDETLLSSKAPLSKSFELQTSVNAIKFILGSWYKTEKSIK